MYNFTLQFNSKNNDEYFYTILLDYRHHKSLLVYKTLQEDVSQEEINNYIEQNIDALNYELFFIEKNKDYTKLYYRLSDSVTYCDEYGLANFDLINQEEN